MKYRRIPGEPIEARQWLYAPGDLIEDRAVWPMVRSDGLGNYYVVTIHLQSVFLAKGDWILPEPDGEHFYPCKPDVFAKTYEPVEPPMLIVPVGFEINEEVMRPGQVRWVTRDYPPLTLAGAKVLKLVTEIVAGLESRNAELEAQLAAEGEHLPTDQQAADSKKRST